MSFAKISTNFEHTLTYTLGSASNSMRVFNAKTQKKNYYFVTCQIVITHKNQVPMLQGPPPVKSSFFFRRRQARDPELESEI